MSESTLYIITALVWLIGALASAISGNLLYAFFKVIIGGICLILSKMSEKEVKE